MQFATGFREAASRHQDSDSSLHHLLQTLGPAYMKDPPKGPFSRVPVGFSVTLRLCFDCLLRSCRNAAGISAVSLQKQDSSEGIQGLRASWASQPLESSGAVQPCLGALPSTACPRRGRQLDSLITTLENSGLISGDTVLLEESSLSGPQSRASGRQGGREEGAEESPKQPFSLVRAEDITAISSSDSAERRSPKEGA